HREITKSLKSARDQYLRPDIRVLDVGCGVQPYFPLFADLASEYAGNDVEPDPRITYVSCAESLPIEPARYDLVLCTQVLEHVRRPMLALGEISRVLKPGGYLLLTTHGVYPYHPDPADYWRWTQEGLAAVIDDVEGLDLVEIVPHGGSASTLAVLVNTAIRQVIRSRPSLARLGTPVIATINAMASLADRFLPAKARAALVANYLVVARRSELVPDDA